MDEASSLPFERRTCPERLMYRARCSGPRLAEALGLMRDSAMAIAARVGSGEFMTLSAFRGGTWLYLYYERLWGNSGPFDLFPGLELFLERFPEGDEGYAAWLPMEPVFHFNEPQGLEHWRRKSPVHRRVGRAATLRPGALASYAFYHYALQEEQGFAGNKYEFIGLDRNRLFLYRELPAIEEAPIHARGLETSATPEDWAWARIPEHFELAPGGAGFSDLELVLSLG